MIILKRIFKFLIPLLILIFAVGLFSYKNYNTITMKINGKSTVVLALGEVYTDEGCTAYFRAKELSTTKSGEVDSQKVGTYLITYTAQSGEKVATAKRVVRVVDTVCPVISAPDSVTVPVGMALSDFEFEFTANDNIDGDITNRATKLFNKDSIFICATDTFGNKAKKEIKVTRVSDTAPPVITLSGFSTVFMQVSSEFEDPGFTALDNIDGDITYKTKVTGYENLHEIGTHTLTYTVFDSSHNITTTNRKVVVYDPEEKAEDSAQKIVYLTFDDGPCVYTPRILEVLRQFDVKATFFVTNQKPDWQNYIAEAAKDGHTIAAHTYSHQYSIYRSKEAFIEDLQAINEVIKIQTGSYTRLMRFPGGSSNTISRKYSKGIMSELVKEVTDQGYIYFDWNVSSGDADGSRNQRNPEYIANNVINRITHKENVVLMHDMNGANIESLPIILEYGIKNGIKFLPLTELSPTAHHGVLN